jgi:hypothetical protein
VKPGSVYVTGPNGGRYGGSQWIAPHTEVTLADHWEAAEKAVIVIPEVFEHLGLQGQRHFGSQARLTRGHKEARGHTGFKWWVDKKDLTPLVEATMTWVEVGGE